MKRKSISKSMRFEVFKRDSFKCQYCGRSAPDVVLQVDHIDPVSKGGEQTNILNLITSCFACNSGKSDRVLSDTTAAQKRKSQLDDLQARREQLEMMAEWQRGLIDLTEEAVNQCDHLWSQIAKGYYLNEVGVESLRKLIRKFGAPAVMAAIPVCQKYLIPDSAGHYTKESVEVAFGKIGGVCVVDQRSKEDPELHEIYKIRAMLMARIPSLKSWQINAKFASLRGVGYSAAEIRSRMQGVQRWFQFDEAVEQMLAEVE